MDAARELADLAERVGGAARSTAVEPLGGVRGVVSSLLRGQPQAEGNGDELLLRTVVEVALDAPAGGIGRATIRARGGAQLGGAGGLRSAGS